MIFFEVSEHDSPNGHRWAAKAFRVQKNGPKMYAYYTFRSLEARERWMDNEDQHEATREKVLADRKAEKTKLRAELKNPYKVGDLLHYSWGYDQTNCDFFQVIAATERTVTIREICSTTVPRSEGFMSDRRGPVPGKFVSDAKPIKKTLQPGTPPYISMPYGSMGPCNPEDAYYCSWYA